jgi:hypothetical protein
MRTIKVKRRNHHFENKKDIQKIQHALIDKGFYATEEQCVELWEAYSEYEWAASWLTVSDYNDDIIYNCLKPYFEPGPENALDMKYI